MKTIDLGSILLTYNFIIGVLVMLSSEKLAGYAGYLNTTHRDKIVRLTRVSASTFGACVAILSASIYIASYILF